MTSAGGPDPLPADAVLVHIGPHKTGTTAVQSVLAQSRRALRRRGVTYPGKTLAHHRPARALVRFRHGWDRDAEPMAPATAWTQFARGVRATSGRVVVSSEFLAGADRRERAQLIRDLGPERVHVVAVAREPAGLTVSVWQQMLRSYGKAYSLDEWLERNVRSTGRAPADGFWWRADPADVVGPWLDMLPAERITVIVLDERDRRLLPQTFERLLDLPAGLLADRKPRQSNRGLTAIEAALVAAISRTLDSRLSWVEYSEFMRKGVIRRIQEARRPHPGEARNTLPAWAIEQVRAQAEQSIAWLQRSGVRIVGEPAALRPEQTTRAPTATISEVPIDLAAEAVVGAIAVATRGHWSWRTPKRQSAPRQTPLDPPEAVPDLADVSTRELVRALAERVRPRSGSGR